MTKHSVVLSAVSKLTQLDELAASVRISCHLRNCLNYVPLTSPENQVPIKLCQLCCHREFLLSVTFE